MLIFLKKNYHYILLAFILALGFFLRIYNIENVPPGIYPDEAVNGIDALTANDTGNYQWFYSANQGREGLFMNLIAFLFKFFGVSALTLKLPAIIFGTLTIWGTYLVAKELFNRRIGLVSAYLTAVSFWPINFNRISFRANMLPFILVFTFYFLLRGLRAKKISSFAIAGFIFGIGLHTYIAFRVAPLILILLLLSAILSRKNFLKEYWKSILVFFLFAIISAAPMLYTFFYTHPEYLESRSSSISIFSPEMNKGNLSGTFLRSFSLSLLKYNFWGDQNWRHNYPPYPLLDTLTGIAFLFGLVVSFGKLFKHLFERIFHKIQDPRIDTYVLLVAWFFTMLIPEFLTAEGLPHALRSIGTFPAVFIFAGITFNFFLEKARERSAIHRSVIAFLAITMLISIGLFNGFKYHYFWANKIETARSFEKIMVDISRYINTVPVSEEVFVAVGNMQRVPVRMFQWKRPGFHDLHPAELTNIQPLNLRHFQIIFNDFEKDNIINSMKAKFPKLELNEFKNNFGIIFYVLK